MSRFKDTRLSWCSRCLKHKDEKEFNGGHCQECLEEEEANRSGLTREEKIIAATAGAHKECPEAFEIEDKKQDISESVGICDVLAQKFKSYVKSLGGQENFAKIVGYKRTTINAFCNGKKLIPKPLLKIMEISELYAIAKTEASKYKRELSRVRGSITINGVAQ